MTNISILIGAAFVAIASAPVSATQEAMGSRAASERCEANPCVSRVPATCTIDPARRNTGTCPHSARDMEELGRQQLDQLIASLN